MVALLLPSGQSVASMEGFLTIFFVIEWNWKEKLTNIREHSRLLIPWMLFFGLYVLGLGWTSNMHEGGFNVQVKLSLFLFPLIIASRRFNTRQTQILLGTFLFGLLAAGIFMLVRAAKIYYTEGVNTFYYQAFAAHMPHPSYLSMYYCTAIMILFHGILLQPFRVRPYKIAAIALCLFYSVIVFLLSSKLGILSMILLFAGYIVYSVIRFRRYVVGISAFLALVFGCIIAFKAFPEMAARLERMKQALFMSEEKIDPSAVESNRARMLVWQADYALVSRHPWTGVGTGDAKDSLVAEYRTRQMTGALHEELNAHSQLFQTAIVLGIPGLAALLLLIFFPAASAMRNQFGFAVLFALLFFLNILPESMLERQDGTLFFGFFYSLILFAIDRRCLSPLKAPPLSF